MFYLESCELCDKFMKHRVFSPCAFAPGTYPERREGARLVHEFVKSVMATQG